MATYVVGDIQGCLEPLKCLLKKVDFRPDRDLLWSVGDVVNRGPDCLETLRFLHTMRDNLVMVLGNHDLHLLAVADGVRPPHRFDTLDEILAAPDRDTLLTWLRHRPLIHREHGFTLVHAGVPPQWSVAEAELYAREVESALQGAAASEFFHQMYGNEPAIWSESLTGMPRLRVITNYLTRMRFCTAEGELDLVSKGPHTAVENMAPWFSHTERRAAGEPILFGHWASLEGRTDSPTAIGLDTGCVWGGRLSMYCLETGNWHRCRCPAR